MDQLYERQSSLGINTQQRVMVVGCGGVGSWVGYFLGLAGVAELELYDGDEIVEHNLNRLPFMRDNIGQPKSVALANLIKKARPDIVVRAYGNFDQWHQENVDAASFMVVSTDSLKSRKMCYEAAKASRCPYIECAAEGNMATVTGSPAEWQSELEDRPGYASVPVFVGPCTLAASIASYYVLLGSSPDKTVHVKWENGEVVVDEAVGV